MHASQEPNITAVVPLIHVSDMARSVPYYVDGLGFSIKHRWEVDGKLRWCWLALGGAAVMLQGPGEGHDSPTPAEPPSGKKASGISLDFQCQDALAFYREVLSRGIEASDPQVGNAMWVTCLTDPDGFRLNFESFTDVPEETKLSELNEVG